MRVVTTSHKKGLEEYGHRWLDSRKNWPRATFHYYTEGFRIPRDDDPDGVDNTGGQFEKDFRDIPEFIEWKAKHSRYRAPSWRYDVVRFAHKVFAAYDALYDYDGIGVWLDADCVTFKPIPEGLIERQLNGAYLAHYGRTGLYTETGLWIVDCSHPEHKRFMDFFRGIYLTDRFKRLPQWHDCFALDATIIAFRNLCKFHNLSGEFHKTMHPQALSELGRYIDHCKGPRKAEGKSPENQFR